MSFPQRLAQHLAQHRHRATCLINVPQVPHTVVVTLPPTWLHTAGEPEEICSYSGLRSDVLKVRELWGFEQYSNKL